MAIKSHVWPQERNSQPSFLFRLEEIQVFCTSQRILIRGCVGVAECYKSIGKPSSSWVCLLRGATEDPSPLPFAILRSQHTSLLQNSVQSKTLLVQSALRDWFTNMTAFDMGFHKKLLLKPGAVQTHRPRHEPPTSFPGPG